jgi:hypothetical protein
MHRASILAALIVFVACAHARAGTGPCKPDQSEDLVCGEGPGAARVIVGTTSPSKQMAFAWRSPGKAPTEEATTDELESVLVWLGSGTALAIAPGDYWAIGPMRANRYDFHAIWSPDSRFVIELLDFRWSTVTMRLHALPERGSTNPVLSLDLKSVMEFAARKEVSKTVKNERYAFEIEGDNSGDPPKLSIDNSGLIKARVQMQVPKEEDPQIFVDIVLQARVRDGALEARPVSIRKAKN